MKIDLPAEVWKVRITEMDSFSGPKVVEDLFFDSEQDAIQAAREVNNKNYHIQVPDYYLTASVSKVK